MAEYGESLTDREKELLQLVATGITNREIARDLCISVNTVKVHLRNIFTKLGAESRTEATMIAVREGWVVVEGAEEPAETTTTETAPTIVPLPPLPWFKRVALIATLLLTLAGLALIWPRNNPRADNGPFPPLPPSASTAPPTVVESSPWHERAQMPTRRAYIAVAVAERRILAIAGQTPEGVTGAVEIYDPEDDLWTRGSSKPVPATYVSAAVIASDVYVPGGCDAEGTPIRTVEVYDVASDTWREVSPLPQPRCAYALTSWDEKLYLFGGWDGERYVATVYVYDPQADAWSEGIPMETKQGFAAAAALRDRLYVVGGYDDKRELATCAIYDPAKQVWDKCAPLAVGRGGLGLVALGGRLYAIGGGGQTSYLGFNEWYDPNRDAWSTVETPLIGEWRSPGVVAFESAIYAIGGWSGDYLSANQAYEPISFRIFIPMSRRG